MKKYKSQLSKKEIDRRRRWQDLIYQDLKKINKPREYQVLGKKIVTLPGIFAPIFTDSLILAKAVRNEVKKGDRVLDLGTGSGIDSIFAATKADKIVATDINEKALECARINFKRHKVDGKLIKSDLFKNIRDKFDLIIFNPPFRWFKPRDVLEAGELDYNYRTLRKFFSEADKYLLRKGRLLMVFSESGDLKYFKSLIETYNYHSEIIIETKTKYWRYQVYKIWK